MDYLHIIQELNVMIEHSAAQWWVIPLVGLFSLIDGIFPILPSETAIVALASVSAVSGDPNIWLLILVASIGAIIGDNIAYLLGRKMGTTRFRWMRTPRSAKTFAWAGKELKKRGTMLIFTARYIPVGRIAVNFTAGATQYPWRRFVIVDSFAVLTWASYSVAMGTFAGRWFHDNPLQGVVIAVIFALVIGFFIDHALRWAHNFLAKRGQGESSHEESDAVHEGAPMANGTQATGRAPGVDLSFENATVAGSDGHGGRLPVPVPAASVGERAQHDTTID